MSLLFVLNTYVGVVTRHISLVSLTPKQIYEEQLELKKKKMVKKESIYIRGGLFC